MARVLAISSLLLLAILALALWRVLDAPIARVQVSGELDGAERVQVEAAIVSALHGGLLSVDLQAIAEELKALSWPRRVSVRRVWPDTLKIDLARALVVAGWGDDYLTIDGQVVQLAAQQHELVRFDCELTAPKTALELYQRLQREAALADLQILHLKENALGEWTLTFANDIVLNIGSSELGARVGRFVAV
jgi:cell division protein FtsQ